MTLTKQVQRIVFQQIRPYILPLPYSDYDDPVWIAAFLSDEDWLRWLKLWASCYIPLRTVCNAFRSLHLGELMVANLFLLRSMLAKKPHEQNCVQTRCSMGGTIKSCRSSSHLHEDC